MRPRIPMARASGAVVTNPAIPHTTISGCAARLISLKSSVYVRRASDSGEMSSFRHADAGSVSRSLGVKREIRRTQSQFSWWPYDCPASDAMLNDRASGLLLHVTSLPSPHGIGDIGPAATLWIDRLAASGQSWW